MQTSRRPGDLGLMGEAIGRKRCPPLKILPQVGLMLLCLTALPLTTILFDRIDAGGQPKFDGWTNLYTRRGAAQPPLERPVELLFVGDIMLGRQIMDSNQPFVYAAGWLAASDLTIGNFEASLGENYRGLTESAGDDPSRPIRLIAPPSAALELQSAGFDLLSLANNHSLDGGFAGLAATAQALEDAGIGVIGAGPSEAAAYLPARREIRGVRLAFLGVNAVRQPVDPAAAVGSRDWRPARWDLKRITEAIQQTRQAADAVIVLAHWGDEYETRPGPSQMDGARRLIEAGADIVIGSHPHTIQPTEVIEVDNADGKQIGFVAYSLGNFVFDQRDPRAQYGIALRVSLDRRGLVGAQALVVQAGPAPRIPIEPLNPGIIARIQPKPAQILFRCSPAGCEVVDLESKADRGQFVSDKIDLTGDGQAETVILTDRQVRIYEEERLVWASPPEWIVLDAALGDPNGDGRAEVVLAIRKPDAQGELRSHPFLIGYRGGIYRQVWGGSAVHFPIREVELLDINQDGTPELVVLEVRPGGQTAVTLWKWQGWVFSQVWSSPEGDLQNLGVVYDRNGGAFVRVESNW